MEFEKIKKIIQDVMKNNNVEISLDTNFKKDLKLDSIDLFSIIMGIEEEFNITIDNEQILDIETVGDAIAKIKNMKN